MQGGDGRTQVSAGKATVSSQPGFVYHEENHYAPETTSVIVYGNGIPPGMTPEGYVDGGIQLSQPEPRFPQDFPIDLTVKIPCEAGDAANALDDGSIKLIKTRPDLAVLPPGKHWVFELEKNWHMKFKKANELRIAIDGVEMTDENKHERRDGQTIDIRPLEDGKSVPLDSVILVKDP
ncbi:MAG: hypothetical protein JWO73_47 [Candidatus Taylorbacteria bacterium]|nr:hypothetical protein [Candidatus Taylorbacteria bacterium]